MYELVQFVFDIDWHCTLDQWPHNKWVYWIVFLEVLDPDPPVKWFLHTPNIVIHYYVSRHVYLNLSRIRIKKEIKIAYGVIHHVNTS